MAADVVRRRSRWRSPVEPDGCGDRHLDGPGQVGHVTVDGGGLRWGEGPVEHRGGEPFEPAVRVEGRVRVGADREHLPKWGCPEPNVAGGRDRCPRPAAGVGGDGPGGTVVHPDGGGGGAVDRGGRLCVAVSSPVADVERRPAGQVRGLDGVPAGRVVHQGPGPVRVDEHPFDVGAGGPEPDGDGQPGGAGVEERRRARFDTGAVPEQQRGPVRDRGRHRPGLPVLDLPYGAGLVGERRHFRRAGGVVTLSAPAELRRVGMVPTAGPGERRRDPGAVQVEHGGGGCAGVRGEVHPPEAAPPGSERRRHGRDPVGA